MNKIILILIAFLLVQCDQQNPPAPGPKAGLDCDNPAGLCEVTQAHTDFGLSAFKTLNREAEEVENLFISPFSISTALTMTANGARGQTLSEMMSTLNLGALSLAEVNLAYRELLAKLPGLDETVQLQIANSIWHRREMAIKQPFLDVNVENYQSEIYAADFTDPATVNLINDWVNVQTNGLIEKIVEDIPPEMVMYLLNAIYFKGSWTRPFDPELTGPATFTRDDGVEVTTDLMSYGETTLPFYQNDQFMMADLPYGDSIFTMTVLLPKEGVRTDALINALDLNTWQNWTSQLKDTKLHFAMPKFKFAYEKELKELLKEMGMETAFLPGQADLTNISDAELYIDGVLHKAFVEVNEEGTEAAAVTSVGVGVTSVPMYPYMILDKPFVFVIRENQTNEILFLGKLADPTKE